MKQSLPAPGGVVLLMGRALTAERPRGGLRNYWVPPRALKPGYSRSLLCRGRSAHPRDSDGSAWLAAQIADGLAAAHSKGVIHRDLKPGNVVIARDGAAKVTEFGITRIEGIAERKATVLAESGDAPGVSETSSYR